ncbi:antigen 1 [Uncinocarpus reesii 1704]|uniref:Antigen 1 n=1 Tax=Uncinocarpus reesii (strain UAMH 1704) TaxID=336963 RepID=C4JGA4_UNCRE|nr:antigen 1 [Uncinocarpus reesii 1704]EEP77653.1 antigen 1 [Uncinocarpus reesii 1704]
MQLSILPLLVIASPLLAAPLAGRELQPGNDLPPCDQGAVQKYPIPKSCNATERRLIPPGLDDAMTLSKRAKEHGLCFGNTSALDRKCFGNAPSGEVIGNLYRIVNADKGNTLFRCDDPDGNCQIPTYGGHWRGSNATGETVICPLSYKTRLFLEYFCTGGYTVSGSPLKTYFGTDLLHRLYHMPAIGEGHVEHFSNTYEDVLQLGAHNSSFAVRDSDTLQYFAADVYGFDIAIPGVGCAGEPSASTPPSPSATTQPPATTAAAVPPVRVTP